MKCSNKKLINIILFLTVAGTANLCSASEDEITKPVKHGEKAHQDHCYKCHGDEVYTRENRFVKSMEALNKQVVRCKEGSDIPWFDEDSDAVVQFLNNKYYRF